MKLGRTRIRFHRPISIYRVRKTWACEKYGCPHYMQLTTLGATGRCPEGHPLRRATLTSD